MTGKKVTIVGAGMTGVAMAARLFSVTLSEAKGLVATKDGAANRGEVLRCAQHDRRRARSLGRGHGEEAEL